MLPIGLLIQKPDEIIKKIKKVEGIKRINQEIKFGSMIIAGDESLDIIARDVDILNTESSSRYRKSVVQGRFPETDSQTILGKPLAEILKVSINDKIILMTSNAFGGINAVELIISGLFKTGIKEEDENFIFMGLNKARNLLQIKDGVSEISLMLENDKLTSEIITQLKPLIKEHDLEIFSDRRGFQGREFDNFVNSLTFFKDKSAQSSDEYYTQSFSEVLGAYTPGTIRRNYAYLAYSHRLKKDWNFGLRTLTSLDDGSGFIYPFISFSAIANCLIEMEGCVPFYAEPNNEFGLLPLEWSTMMKIKIFF